MTLSLRLPPDASLQVNGHDELESLRQLCTYDLTSVSHGLRHAYGLLAILAMHIGSSQRIQDLMSPTDYTPWLVDTYFMLDQLRSKWPGIRIDHLSSSLQSVLDLARIVQTPATVMINSQEKCSSLLIHLTTEMAEHLEKILPSDEDHDTEVELLGLSFLTLAGLSIQSKSIADLVTLQLLPRLDGLVTEGELFTLMPSTTDLGVSTIPCFKCMMGANLSRRDAMTCCDEPLQEHCQYVKAMPRLPLALIVTS